LRLGTPEKSGNLSGNYTRVPSSNSESPWKKMIGKPYSGKPTVRFDEGELEIELIATTPALYSTGSSIEGRLEIERISFDGQRWGRLFGSFRG
jgi:hypothetical protein